MCIYIRIISSIKQDERIVPYTIIQQNDAIKNYEEIRNFRKIEQARDGITNDSIPDATEYTVEESKSKI